VVKYLASFYSGLTTAIASASVTAASFASSKVLIASSRPRQLDEADRIALNLLASSGVAPQDAAAGFAYAELRSRHRELPRSSVQVPLPQLAAGTDVTRLPKRSTWMTLVAASEAGRPMSSLIGAPASDASQPAAIRAAAGANTARP